MLVDNTKFLSIRLGSSHAFFIPSKNGAIIVDAGNVHKITQLKSVLHAHEHSLSEISYIILTHTHQDHVGSLVELKQRTGAKIIVHEKEADYLRMGKTPLPKGVTFYAKTIVAIGKMTRFGAYPPIGPDILVTHRLDLSDIGIDGYILHTPGHTEGSMSVVLKSGVAFIGDTMFNIQPDTVFPPFANDTRLLLQSWRLLLETGCNIFYPSHGKPIEVEKFRRCLLRRERKIKGKKS